MLTLTREDGTHAFVDEGEFARIRWSFVTVPLMEDVTKEDILTITATLFDTATRAVINNKLNVNVLDLNGGLLTNELEFSLLLSSADNAIVAASGVGEGLLESHILRIQWTWQTAGVEMKGIQDFSLSVRRLHVPVGA